VQPASEALDNGAHSEGERLLRCVQRDAWLMMIRTVQQPCPRRYVTGQSPGQPEAHQHGRAWTWSLPVLPSARRCRNSPM